MAAAVMMATQLAYAQEEVLWDGFEGQMKWEPVQWENVGQVELSLSKDYVTQGEEALRVDMLEEQINWKNKVAFSREDYLNLEDMNKVVMDVYCPYPFGITVGLAFDAGEDWTYLEMPSKPLKKGWNKDLSFDISKSNFKSSASDWKHTMSLEPKNDVRKMHILIYCPAKMEVQTVYIDNVRFE